MKCVKNYVGKGKPWSIGKLCPKSLLYQFTNEFTLKVSDDCCKELKEKPFKKYQQESNRHITILGITLDEGGQRETAQCLAFKGDTLRAFQPLVPVSKEWERWFIQKYDIKLPILYYPPYNFERTGCKGCPYNIKLEKDLDMLARFLPNERKQCEIIWKPVYDEYRRIGYRLKKNL
jgi:3'-phosphoadenosine 5'-phosphosulfate sulfotransferase (PAPS reductase)/FAD synthetase